MKKRIAVIIGMASVTAAVAAVSVFTLTNTKGNDRSRNADSPERLEAAGETLLKADDQEKMPLDKDTIYTDDDNNMYYINNDNGYLELVIAGDPYGSEIALYEEETTDDAILEAAEAYVMEWYKDYEPDRFEWSIEEDTESTKRVYMRQMMDGREVGTIAAMTYTDNGSLVSGSFWFDAVLSEEQMSDLISKEEALELAGAILEDRYNTSPDDYDTIKVVTNTHGGHNYWYITYISDNGVVNGYTIEIDKTTGETGNISQLK